MTVSDTFVALVLIGLFLVLGKILRRTVPLFERIYLPTSILAGGLALLVGPQVMGDGLLPESVLEVWAELPVLLISIVFAGLFIGKRIPSPRRIWEIAGPQVALGQSIAWGQYVVGLLLGILVLSPFFGLPPMAGALIEIGFEGGHGTSAGLADTFEAFDFPEGTDLALGLATVGLVTGVLLGTVLINWGVRSGRLTLTENGDVKTEGEGDDPDLANFDEREGVDRHEGKATDPLSIHFGFIAVAIALGWILQQGLVELEAWTWKAAFDLELFEHIPLFPLAMIGGVLLQLLLDRLDRPQMVDRRLVNRISGMALDVIIVAALGTISLESLGGNLGPFVILAAAGITWNVVAFLVLAPRFIPEHAYERGLGDFGQSMGMTVTGLLLMRIADPANRSGGLEAFGYKQLMFEPVVGGGLFTAASIPLIAQLGPWWVLALTTGLLIFWIVVGMRGFERTD